MLYCGALSDRGVTISSAGPIVVATTALAPRAQQRVRLEPRQAESLVDAIAVF